MNFNIRKSFSALVLIASVLAIGFVAAHYRRYAHAVLWHCVHKDPIKFGTHEMSLPELWWAAKADNHGRISISRAYNSVILAQPEIDVRPATPGEMMDSDAEQVRLVNAVVSRLNHDPQSGWTHSVATLRATKSTWYCIRSTQTLFARHVFTTLACNCPQIPYSLHYQGPPEQEKEAEAIFASFN